MRPICLIAPFFVLAAGCGGTGSSNVFEGTWTGTGTLTNSSNKQVASGSVTMLVDSSGNVAGSDNVTLDGQSETEAGSITSAGGSLTLAEGVSSYVVQASVNINSSGEMIWTGTEKQGTATYTLSYTLLKG